MAQAAITTTAVRNAAAELAAMRRSLAGWLKYKTLNDAVLAGHGRTRLPPAHAARIVADRRDMRVEGDLAVKLHALLSTILPDAELPRDAASLAKIALAGALPTSSPVSVGNVGVTHPWLWPVLIVGGLLLGVTTAIKTAADVAKDREEKACIEAGACTDYGFWLKAGGVTVLAWFAWKELGLGDLVRGLIKKGGR